jgi:hypothetical protein
MVGRAKIVRYGSKFAEPRRIPSRFRAQTTPAFHVNGAILCHGLGGCGSLDKLFARMVLCRSANCRGSKDLDPTLSYMLATGKHHKPKEIETVRRLQCR